MGVSASTYVMTASQEAAYVETGAMLNRTMELLHFHWARRRSKPRCRSALSCLIVDRSSSSRAAHGNQSSKTSGDDPASNDNC